MKSELDILNYGGHDYLLSASALPLEEQLFQPHFSILGKKRWWDRKELKLIDELNLRGICFVMIEREIDIDIECQGLFRKEFYTEWSIHSKKN